MGDPARRATYRVLTSIPAGIPAKAMEYLWPSRAGSFLTYQVHNEAIVIPENVDAIRAVTASEPDGAKSIALTEDTLGIRTELP